MQKIRVRISTGSKYANELRAEHRPTGFRGYVDLAVISNAKIKEVNRFGYAYLNLYKHNLHN